MSVLIKGMEMPTSCSVCPMLEGDRMDGLCHAASKWLDDDEHWTWYVYPEGDVDDSKPCNCPLVPVPEHGRLGDLDELYASLKKWLIQNRHSMTEATRVWIRGVLEGIAAAPTIIPASGGKEDE